MWKHWTHLIPLVVALALILGGPAYAFGFDANTDESLVGWWKLDDGSGTIAVDSSPGGHDGTLTNGPVWTTGWLGGAVAFDGVDDYVDTGYTDNLATWTISAWVISPAAPAATSPTGPVHRESNYQFNWNHTDATYQAAVAINAGGWYAASYGPLEADTWYFLTGTYDGEELKAYRNGELITTNGTPSGAASAESNSLKFGRHAAAAQYFEGTVDDVRVYDRALILEEIQLVMLGGTVPELARNPVPADEATDVPRDDDLDWSAGDFAVAHDVYLGTSFDDVNEASRSNPLGVLIGQDQPATTFDPGRLEFGQTYYWRIDEVNGAPDNTVFKGDVWSFTVEPYTYPIANVAVSTNATSTEGSEPEKMVDGSGLNAAGQHSTNVTDMWQGTPTDGPVVIDFAFDTVYKLDEMRVWNYNVMFELMLGFGLKDVTVEYSADGVDWTVLGDVVFAQATAKATYEANTFVDFGGAAVKYVKLTVNSGYGSLGQYGLSEVQFMYIPAQAREPQPDDGDTGVAPDASLAWRPGREADVHDVYVSASAEAVLDGSALIDSVANASYDLASLGLEFGTTYYWKVNEVNDVEPITSWEGPLWRFAMEDYSIVEDFESYTDDEGSRIYETWDDGWVNDTGAVVGYLEAPFAEQSVVFSGHQSMPLEYDNEVAPFYSQADRAFNGAKWNTNGADRVIVHFRGQPVTVLERGDGVITVGAGGADIWGTADEFRYVYKSLSGDGSIIARVDSIANSDPWAKAGVMIRESLMPNATHAMVVVTPENGVSFQRRVTSGGDSANTDAAGLVAPYWVKLTRTGDVFTAQQSADGVTWVDIAPTSPVEISMASNIYIGLAVTSHNSNEMTIADFSNISTTGSVTGQWQTQAIGVAMPSNDPAPVYVKIEDGGGSSVVARHPDSEASLLTAWQSWEIPFTELSGVNLGNVATFSIGVGNPDSPSADGTGLIFVDDIGFGRPASTPADVTAAGDAVQGVPNDGDWPDAETPDLAIDDDVNTKYLHFKGDFDPDAGPTGIQVTPAVGPTVVTGLTFTTANDVPGRDPIAFELYGSKDSIDGPYTLIAAGDIVDFAGATEWPRFTKTTTPITFDNVMAYSHYQVLFTAIRGPVGGSVNSMQIAEIELLGLLAP